MPYVDGTLEISESGKREIAEALAASGLSVSRGWVDVFLAWAAGQVEPGLAALFREADGPPPKEDRRHLEIIRDAMTKIIEAAPHLGMSAAEAIVNCRTFDVLAEDGEPRRRGIAMRLAGGICPQEFMDVRDLLAEAAESIDDAAPGAQKSPFNRAKRRYLGRIASEILSGAESAFDARASQKRGGWAHTLLAVILGEAGVATNAERLIANYQRQRRRQEANTTGSA
jgi:hypothetical protein